MTQSEKCGPSRPSRVVYSKSDDFTQEVTARMVEYFETRSRRDDPRFYKKAAIVFLWIAVSYTLLLSVHIPWVQVILCVSLGISIAVGGFNVFHDSIHGSASHSRRVNEVIAFVTCSILGASRYLWAFKHNHLHHSYPNILHFDDDLETRGAMRLTSQQPWKKNYRYQHIWGWGAYSLSIIEWIFIKDFVQYFSLKMGDQKIKPFKPAQKLEFWVSKAVWFCLFIGIPLMVFSPLTVLLGIFLVYPVTGLTLALIFQLAHVSSNCEFLAPDAQTGAMNHDYYYVQMATTTNFATENPFVTWLSGGLNFQVEHHLWPQISHTHYPALAPIVKEVALKHGVPYNSYKTYREALKAHYGILRDLGFNTYKDKVSIEPKSHMSGKRVAMPSANEKPRQAATL